MHKTTFSASLDYFVTSSPPYLHQFSAIFGGNCININDVDEYANSEEQFFTDREPVEHSPYSVYQSSFHPKMPQKSFLPRHIWETLSESTKQMIIEHNKKVKLNSPTPYPSGSKAKPNPTLVSLPLH